MNEKKEINFKLLNKSLNEIKENELKKFIDNKYYFLNEIKNIIYDLKNINFLNDNIINDYEIFLLSYFFKNNITFNNTNEIFKNLIELYKLFEIEIKENNINENNLYYVINNYYLNIKKENELSIIIKKIIINILNVNKSYNEKYYLLLK